MVVFQSDLEITNADSLDYQIYELAGDLKFAKKGKKNIPITIDTSHKTVSIKGKTESFDEALVWVIYNKKNGKTIIKRCPKSKHQLYLSDSISGSLLFLFYDKSTDKLYINSQKRYFYPNTVVPNIKIITDSKHDKVFVDKKSFDRWDTLVLYLKYIFLYYLAIMPDKSFDVYHDLKLGFIQFFPNFNIKYLLINKNASIVLKDSSLKQIKFKLVQFGQDFTNDFQNKKYKILDQNGSTVSSTYDSTSNCLNVDIANITTLSFIPINLERVFMNNAYIVINNVININIFKLF